MAPTHDTADASGPPDGAGDTPGAHVAPGPGPMSAAQAAAALGVRVPTVYAYVSRGVLGRTLSTDARGHRTSSFDRDEVLRLAALRRRPGAGLQVLVESDVTDLDPEGRLAFRGRPLAEVLALGSVERAAALVWDEPVVEPWCQDDDVAAALEAARPWLATVADPRRRVVAGVTAAASGARGGGAPSAVARQAWLAAVEALGAPGTCAATVHDGPVADRLAGALLGRDPDAGAARLLTACLCALIDHELSASTVATRVAASLHADPWSCLLAGLHAMTGERQSGAVLQAAAVLDGWVSEGSVPVQRPAGFGHVVYERLDPRAEALLDVLADVDADLHADVVALTVEVARAHSTFPNVDLALAAAGRHLGLTRDQVPALFLVARIPGLAAHVAEELPHDLRYRPRSV